jgi:hypothetical protein
MRRPHRSPRLATLCLQGNTANSTKDNPERSTILNEAIARLYNHRDWHPLDALVLPGGYFRLSRTLGALSFEERKQQVEREHFASVVRACLARLRSRSPKMRLLVGVMATARHKAERTEQACIAFDATGVIGLARKIFPTSAETVGRRYMSPCLDDFAAKERFVALPNGSVALLNSCYDMFGAADAFSSFSARRSAIRAVRRGTDHITHRDPEFRSIRDTALASWNALLAEQRPDVLLASIHAFERPGLDGYWQRHGIARASARFGGALALGAAHFLESLPSEGSPLAAFAVPKAALAAGVNRRAYPLAPRRILRWTTKAGAPALLRLFETSSRDSIEPGR